MKIKTQISFSIILLILGIAISAQYRTTKTNGSRLGAETKKIQDVQVNLIREKENSNRYLQEIDDLQKKIITYQNNSNWSEVLKKELKTARILAGVTDVKGKGLIISIDDSDAKAEGLGEIRQGDLLDIINDLRSSGAQAISINGQRVIVTTEIREAGNFMRINNNKCSSPFIIKAIGDPATMGSSLKMRGGIVDTITNSFFGGLREVKVNIKRDDNIFINKFSGTLDFNLLNRE